MGFKLRRPNGGFKRHIVPVGKHGALCGYAPASPKGHLIRGRGHWANTFEFNVDDPSICQECLRRYNDDSSEPGHASTQ